MFYIHQCTCISPQQTFPVADLTVMHSPADNKLLAIEPAYDDIPKGVLRRMSKPVRIGIGAALPLLKQTGQPDGIIIGTANAGMEDCFHFLKQIIEYNEGLLTPGNFVQSTPNALAAQVGMLTKNKGYNITHVHLGLAFENAMIDAAMLIDVQPGNTYLLGAVDDISSHNYNINLLDGWFKDEPTATADLYDSNTKGSIPGEGTAMFLVNGERQSAIAEVVDIATLHSNDELLVKQYLNDFIDKNLPPDEKIDLLISGENGDNRMNKYYAACEELISSDTGIIRYKHLSGEYPTASAMAVWLACYILQNNPLPAHLIKKNPSGTKIKNILIYNTFKGAQHSFILLSGA